MKQKRNAGSLKPDGSSAEDAGRREMNMSLILKRITVCFLTVLLCACGQGNHMIGPRTESAWKEWEKQQKELKETWGETPVYAYIQTILDDLANINARVVFNDDFSLETDSPELDALKKLYEDMKCSETFTLSEFLARLSEHDMRYAVGGMLDLDKIEAKEDGVYEVTALYYPNADSLMNVTFTVRKNEDGSFRAEF